MNDRLQIILDACIEEFGSDFTIKNRYIKHTHARAAFYYVAKDKKTSRSSIGRICGNRGHATVLHGLKNVGKKDGMFMSDPEFVKILRKFENKLLRIANYKTDEEVQRYYDKLIDELEELQEDNTRLRRKMFLKQNIVVKEIRRSDDLYDILTSLPDGLLQDFKETRLIPYIKMNRHLFKEKEQEITL